MPAFCEMMGLRAPDEGAAQAAERQRLAGARPAGQCGSLRGPPSAAGSRSGKSRGAVKEHRRGYVSSAPGASIEVEVHRS